MIEILGFLGGGVFRMMFESVMSYFQKKQDHAFEVERMQLSFDLDVKRAEIAARAAEATAKHELEQLAKEYAGKAELAEIDQMTRAFEAASKPSGIWIVDLLNGLVRPTVTWLLVLSYVVMRVRSGVPYSPEMDGALLGTVLGFFFCDRSIRHKQGL